MSDDTYDPGLDGKVVWPINVSDIVKVDDAYATLFDISEAKIQVSHYHQNGDDLTGGLEIHLISQQVYTGAPSTYFAKPLKEALEEELEVLEDSDDTDERRRKSGRLIELLLKAYAEWEA